MHEAAPSYAECAGQFKIFDLEGFSILCRCGGAHAEILHPSRSEPPPRLTKKVVYLKINGYI